MTVDDLKVSPECYTFSSQTENLSGRLLVGQRVGHLLDGLPHRIFHFLLQQSLVDCYDANTVMRSTSVIC